MTRAAEQAGGEAVLGQGARAAGTPPQAAAPGAAAEAAAEAAGGQAAPGQGAPGGGGAAAAPEGAAGGAEGAVGGEGPPRLSPAEAARLREVLGDPAALAATVREMSERFFGRPGDAAGPGRAAAVALGWIAPGPEGRLTPLGALAADSCREHRFWEERGRLLPFETGAPPLTAGWFAGRTVVEIGCGMGANLMSLEGLPGRRVGVEPVPLYRQIGETFRAALGLAPLEIREGGGEAIPAADGEADVVLCVTAHQYMDLRRALAEMGRALRPGGELVLIGGTLGAYLKGCAPARAKSDAITVVNTLGYMATGRRPIAARGASTTSRPIYPTVAWMTRLLRASGFTLEGRPFPIGAETCFLARKAGTAGGLHA